MNFMVARSLKDMTYFFDKNKISYIGLLIFCIVSAAVISAWFSRDSGAYQHYFNSFGKSSWANLKTEVFHKELFFAVVSKAFYKAGIDVFFLFLIFSAISLTVKFYLIAEHSKDKLLSLAFFISYFFILHDSTQIRFGMAVAFVYLGLHFLVDNRRFVFSGIVILSAFLFHNAVLVFIVMLLFTNRKSSLWLLWMVVIAILLYSININIISSDLVGGVVDYFGVEGTKINKLHAYILKPSSDIFLGMFRPIALMVYFCAIVIYQYREKFSAYEMLCFNALLLSIFFYILLKDIPDLQVRFSDMFGFSLVFLVPYVHRALSEYMGRRNAYIVLFSFFAVHLVKYTIYDRMLVF
jgi:hypothetical protein